MWNRASVSSVRATPFINNSWFLFPTWKRMWLVLIFLKLWFWTLGFFGPCGRDDFVLLGQLFLFFNFVFFHNVVRKGTWISFNTILQSYKWMHTVWSLQKEDKRTGLITQASLDSIQKYLNIYFHLKPNHW